MEKELLQYFKSLGADKQKQLVNHLMENISDDINCNSVHLSKENQLKDTGVKCPHCQSTMIVGYGHPKGVKRYKCKLCLKTFSMLTGTAVHRLHKKALLNEYVYHMLSGLSLRKIAEEMDICLKTAFDWRHKLLNSINNGFSGKISGVIEADETFFLYSEKGSKSLKRKPRKRGGSASKKGINSDHVTVMTAFERKTGALSNTVVCKGRLTKKAIEKGVGKWLDKRHCILCSDSHLSFQAYAKINNIELNPIFIRRKEYVFEKIYHIQNVNRIHRQLKDWIRKFNGIATKYLQNYLNYFRLINLVKGQSQMAQYAISNIIESGNAFIQRNKINQLNCIT
jgi:transposase-like protein